MVSKKQASQVGSVSSLVLAVVISATLLLGSVYYLRQRGERIRQEQETEQYESNKASEKEDKNKKTNVTQSQTNTATTAVQVEVYDNLPTTGPGSVALKSLGLFMVTVSLASYIGSRRKLSYYL